MRLAELEKTQLYRNRINRHLGGQFGYLILVHKAIVFTVGFRGVLAGALRPRLAPELGPPR